MKIVCQKCQGVIYTQDDKKIQCCPYCGADELTIVEDNKLFGVKIKDDDISPTFLWILFVIVVVVLFIMLFNMV